MRSAARSVSLNWKNKIEYGRKKLRKWKIRVADTVKVLKSVKNGRSILTAFSCADIVWAAILHFRAAERLQWVKGIILMPPYDPSYYLLHGQGERFRGLIEEGSVLQSDGLEAIYKDVDAHKEAYCFADAFEDVKDRNMCIVVGGGDDIAPGKHMIMPLWNRLKEHDTVAVQKQITFDCNHCMCNVRMALAEYIAQFMKEVLGE